MKRMLIASPFDDPSTGRTDIRTGFAMAPLRSLSREPAPLPPQRQHMRLLHSIVDAAMRAGRRPSIA